MSDIGIAIRRALPIVVLVGAPVFAAIAAMGVTLHWTDFDELAPATTTTIIEAPTTPSATTGTYPPLRLPEPLLGPLPVPPLPTPTTTTEVAITYGLPTVTTAPNLDSRRPNPSPPTVPPMPTVPTVPPATTVPDPTATLEPTIPPTAVTIPPTTTTTTGPVTTTTGLAPAVGRECASDGAEVTILTAPPVCVGGVWQLAPVGP